MSDSVPRLTRIPHLLLSIIVLAACTSEPYTGPDALRPQGYMIERLGDVMIPTAFWQGRLLDSAFLIPVAVGRTIDQRLVNDRTGRGGTGGSSRDTTVARGQFHDVRVTRGGERDSTVVDVMIRDTVVIITRLHPDPTRVRSDSGWFVDGRLVLPTIIDYRQKWPFHVAGIERCPEPMRTAYWYAPCAYQTTLTYRLE
jgi:hypothetical protein